MKLNKIRVQNFRNISDTTLDTGGAKFVVVRGANRNGKTSIAEAISLALTPTTWGLDSRGAGFARKIKRGETKATLEIDLQGANRSIQRKVNLSLTASGRTQISKDESDPTWNPIKFEKLLDDKKTAIGIAINTRQFMSMVYSGDEKSQKNLLAQLVLPARYDFPKDTVADVDAILGQGAINFDGEPFAVIEQAYKKLYKEREDLNRTLKGFTVPAPLTRPQGVDSASLKSELVGLRESRKALSDERYAAIKKANEASIQQVRTKAKIDTLEAALRANKEALRLLNENILTDVSACEQIAGSKAVRDSPFADYTRIATEQEMAMKEFGRISKIAESAGSVCPTCEQEIDEAKIIKMVEYNTSERNRLGDEYAAVKKSLASLGDVDGAIVKLEKHKKAMTERPELLKKIEDQTAELNTAKQYASNGGTGLFDTDQYDDRIAKADAAIEVILGKIQPVIAAEEIDKEIATKKEQLKKLEEKVSKTDSLVKFFDKDGIKAKLIKEHIGGFEEKVNLVLSAWDYSCSLSIEPFNFEVTDYRKVATPLIDLSGAEELMFHAAFQCAVSKTAGIGFVVIDRVDTLLSELRPKMYKRLYEMVDKGVLDQVILLVADTSKEVPKLAGSAFFSVEEGIVRRLG